MTEKINNLNCVLLIDDDAATNFYHTIILEDENSEIHIQSVSSAKEGLDFLLCKGSFAKHPNPGIIFLDINMPGMSGWDFLTEYKNLSTDIQEQAVVVMLSTSVNPDDREKAESYTSVKDFVNKPLTPEAFWKIVHKNFN
jgi:CheY-like chemotaxis protein